MAKKILIAISVVIVLTLLILGIGYYLLTSPPPAAVSTLSSELSLEITKESPEAVANFEEKIKDFIQEIKEAQKAGEIREVRLVVTEEEVTSMISKQLAKEKPTDIPFDLKEVKVYFREGRLHLVVSGNVHGINIITTTIAKVSVIAGKPEITVETINMGRLPLPGVITDRLREFLTKQLERAELINLPIEVTSIVIHSGQLEITGVTK